MTVPASTDANDFLRATALALMEDPDFSARASAARFDPVENAQMSSEVAARTLALARSKLLSSKASVAFEALCVSDREALADSAETTFGSKAAAALRADSAAYAKIPQRSASLLSAWRFPDGSFLLCSRSADESLAAFGTALLASPAFLALLSPERRQSISRSLLLAASPDGAFPLSKAELASMLSSMRHGDGWKNGTRVLSTNGSATLAPDELIASLEAPAGHVGLDQILADLLAQKASPPPTPPLDGGGMNAFGPGNLGSRATPQSEALP